MADRKKVQKIRTKRTVKFKASDNENVKRRKLPQKESQPIQMSPLESKTPNNAKKPKNSQKTRPERLNNSSSHVNAPEHTKSPKSNIPFSVIRGKKGEIKTKRLITIGVSLIVVISILVFCFTSPTGPVERITNAFALMGEGEYPASLAGTKVLSVQTAKNKYFALTNSHLCGYNYSGKNFLLLQHNFSNPVLEVSQERVLIYNRESNKFIISNNSGTLFDENLESSIFCADISYNGSVAFVCETSSYAAVIKVFDKNMEQYYTWYLADGLVSDITLSNDGQYVAFAVLKVKDGMFSSEIYCLDTEEKKPLYVKELPNETVYKVENISDSTFAYTSDKKLAFLNWENGDVINKNKFGAPTYFTKIHGYQLALYGEANRSEIVLFDSSGEIIKQFEYNGIIDDISVFDERIYVLTGNKVVYFNFSNKNKKTKTLDSKPEYILAVEEGFLSIKNSNIDFVSSK